MTAGHVENLRGGVHDFVEREQSEVPGHELDDWPEANHRCTDANPSEAELGNRSIDDAHRPELVEQSLRHFVGAVVLRDFLSHEEDAVVALQLLAKRLGQRVTVSEYRHQELVSV